MTTETEQTPAETCQRDCAPPCDDACALEYASLRARLDAARPVVRKYIEERERIGATNPLDEDLVAVVVCPWHRCAPKIKNVFEHESPIGVEPPADGSIMAFVPRATALQMVPVGSTIAAKLSSPTPSKFWVPMLGSIGQHAILTTYVHATHTLR